MISQFKADSCSASLRSHRSGLRERYSGSQNTSLTVLWPPAARLLILRSVLLLHSNVFSTRVLCERVTFVLLPDFFRAARKMRSIPGFFTARCASARLQAGRNPAY